MNSAVKQTPAILLAGAFSLFCFSLITISNHSATAQSASSSIGLEIGQRAPEFAATDQSGRTQTNETLKGPKGTVLLFFRSADW